MSLLQLLDQLDSLELPDGHDAVLVLDEATYTALRAQFPLAVNPLLKEDAAEGIVAMFAQGQRRAAIRLSEGVPHATALELAWPTCRPPGCVRLRAKDEWADGNASEMVVDVGGVLGFTLGEEGLEVHFAWGSSVRVAGEPHKVLRHWARARRGE